MRLRVATGVLSGVGLTHVLQETGERAECGARGSFVCKGRRLVRDVLADSDVCGVCRAVADATLPDRVAAVVRDDVKQLSREAWTPGASIECPACGARLVFRKRSGFDSLFNGACATCRLEVDVAGQD